MDIRIGARVVDIKRAALAGGVKQQTATGKEPAMITRHSADRCRPECRCG